MAFFLHVDKISDDDAADITQPQLTGNFRHGFHIGPEDRVRQVGVPGKTTGIDINDSQRLSLVNDQVTAAFEIDPAVSQAIPLVFNAIMGKNLRFPFI